jgi:hypothetical protein
MARLNLPNLNFGARTHEGAPARNIFSGAAATPLGPGLPALGEPVL